jgi:metallophosphoesterase superfamily enzyme
MYDLDRRWLLRKYGDNSVLIVSDLHLGFEVEWFGRGIRTNDPNWSIEIIKVLKKDILKIKPTHLLICGDLEHHYSIKSKKQGKKAIIEIPTEMSDTIINRMKTEILSIKNLEKIIICGENDLSIFQELKNECQILPSSGKGLFDNQLGAFHGDSIPFKDIVFSSDIVLGHVHPIIEMRDELQIKHQFPVFVKLDLLREDIFSLFDFPFEFEEVGMVDLTSIRILPAYNPYLSGYLLNKTDGGRKLHKPFPAIKKILRHPEVQVQLTDGVDLGLLSDI